MKSITLIIFLTFSLLSINAMEKVIIKANILKGDNFVTASTNPQEIENIFKTALSQKGFHIISETNPNDTILYVDLFVYQFPAEFPTVTVTIRTKGGIHLIDRESTRIFIDRNSANIKLAKKLADRLPLKIDMNAIFKLTVNDLLASNSTSFLLISTDKNKTSNYSFTINWLDNKTPNFIIPNEIHYYSAYISNYHSIRNKLKENFVKLKLKINNEARLEITDIESKIDLTEKEKNKLRDFVDGFPLWIVDSPIDNFEIKIGIE